MASQAGDVTQSGLLIADPIQQNPNAESSCCWNCRSVCLGFFGAVAIAASGVAIALLFTPIGAGALTTGLLIGGAVVLAVTGVALLATLIFQSSILGQPKTAAEYLESLPNAPSESKTEDIIRLATYMLPHCIKHFSSTEGIFRVSADLALIDTMRNKRLPADGSFPWQLFDAHLLAGYLKSLFRSHKITGSQVYQDPIVPFTNGGLSESNWNLLNDTARNTQQSKETIIQYLQSSLVFGNRPTCVIYYILLLHGLANNHAITQMTAENLARAALNPLFLATFECHNTESIAKTALSEFIITHAPEIFPEEAKSFFPAGWNVDGNNAASSASINP